MEAIAEAPDTLIRPGMEPVIETVVQDIARDLVLVRLYPFGIVGCCTYCCGADSTTIELNTVST